MPLDPNEACILFNGGSEIVFELLYFFYLHFFYEVPLRLLMSRTAQLRVLLVVNATVCILQATPNLPEVNPFILSKHKSFHCFPGTKGKLPGSPFWFWLGLFKRW